MNSNVHNPIVKMEQEELKQLTAEVKETVAVYNVEASKQSVFSAADLWYIQKMKKGYAPRKTFIV
jgi:hypothetical protein